MKLSSDNFKGYLKNSWSNSWPIILIMFFEFLIGITDVYIAGKISKEIQASIGFVSQIYFILIVIGNAFTMGVVSISSKLFTGSRDEFYEMAYTSVITILSLSAILTFFAITSHEIIVNFIKAPIQIKPYILEFLKIYSFMLFFHYFLIVTNGILRSSKRIKTSLFTMFIVFITNVGTNILYVFYTPLGYKGIALSTLTAIFVGFLINLIFIRKDITHTKRFRTDLIKRAFSIGWPSGVVQIGWQVASVVIFMILSSLPENPTIYLAAFTNGIRVESIIFLPSFAFSMANAVIVGNLMGEKKYDDAYRNSLFTSLLGCGIISIITIIVVLNADRITSLLSKDPLVVRESARYLYISAVSEPFMAVGSILIGALNGAGDTKATMIRILTSLWGVRIPLALISALVFGFGAYGVWWAMTISIIIQAILIYKRHKSKRWIKHDY